MQFLCASRGVKLRFLSCRHLELSDTMRDATAMLELMSTINITRKARASWHQFSVTNDILSRAWVALAIFLNIWSLDTHPTLALQIKELPHHQNTVKPCLSIQRILQKTYVPKMTENRPSLQRIKPNTAGQCQIQCPTKAQKQRRTRNHQPVEQEIISR